MRPGSNPVAAVATTFVTGAAAGLAVFIGAAWLQPEAAEFAFDWLGDGLGPADAVLPSWLFGHVALIVHHILPGIIRG